MTRQTKAQKMQNYIYGHALDSARYEKFKAVGLEKFSGWLPSIERAQAIIDAGLTFEEWLPWRQSGWDVDKYDILTPDRIKKFIDNGWNPTQAKREISRTYPAPMRTK